MLVRHPNEPGESIEREKARFVDKGLKIELMEQRALRREV